MLRPIVAARAPHACRRRSRPVRRRRHHFRRSSAERHTTGALGGVGAPGTWLVLGCGASSRIDMTSGRRRRDNFLTSSFVAIASAPMMTSALLALCASLLPVDAIRGL